MRLWETLLAATERKGTRLNQASQQQQFNRGVEDLEIWLSEVEGQLLSEDYGKDLTIIVNDSNALPYFAVIRWGVNCIMISRFNVLAMFHVYYSTTN